MNAGEVVINAAIGTAIAFVGSWVISLIRSPKLLDEERTECIAGKESQVKALKSERDDLRNQLAGPKISPLEQERKNHVGGVLKNYGPDEIALLE